VLRGHCGHSISLRISLTSLRAGTRIGVMVVGKGGVRVPVRYLVSYMPAHSYVFLTRLGVTTLPCTLNTTALQEYWDTTVLDAFPWKLIETRSHRESELLRKVVFPVPFRTCQPFALNLTVHPPQGECPSEVVEYPYPVDGDQSC
jgi:hypothetical protein